MASSMPFTYKPSARSSTKPKLAVTTPVMANFPRDITSSASDAASAVSVPSAVSERTPLSAISRTSAFRDPLPSSGLPSAGLPSARSQCFPGPIPTSAGIRGFEDGFQKTPITPPVAYLDFLKGMTLQSPNIASPTASGKMQLNRASTTSSAAESIASDNSNSSRSANSDGFDKEKTCSRSSSTMSTGEPAEEADSAPASSASENTDVSCHCNDDDDDLVHKSPKAVITTTHCKSPPPRTPLTSASLQVPPSSAALPLSAPPTGAAVFPSLKVPASPAVSLRDLASPHSPFSAKSLHSPFDWDAALKSQQRPGSRRYTEVAGASGNTSASASNGGATVAAGAKRDGANARTSTVRHIREVVTRTVTYTPRMGPAPKGKRRKVDHETAVES